MYTEVHRNKLHFSQPSNWMNDPNGMVYYDGEYHLFYQYYPDAIIWGPMHWGHAVSKDLVRWENLPIALYPDDLGYIFSGSAVVDWKNTSGFGSIEKPPMVAFFTHHDPIGEKAGKTDFECQSIAYSIDKGRTWIKYEANPVVPNEDKIKDFRDPKVIWDETHDLWIMVLAAKDRLRFYGSQNLKEWTYLSEWGQNYGDRKGVWECPDLFPMKVAGSNEVKWVLILSLNPGAPNGGSGTQYFVGDFDGATFTLDAEFEQDILDGEGVWIDYGPDNYAGVTYADIPKSDGRRIFMAWMSNWLYAQVVPTAPWRSAMTLPRTLTLHLTEEGYRICSAFVNEVVTLQSADPIFIDKQIVGAKVPLAKNLDKGFYRLQLEVKKSEGGTFGVVFSNSTGERMVLGYDSATNNYFLDRSHSGKIDFQEQFQDMIFAPIKYAHDTIKLDVIVDLGAIEVIADDGLLSLTGTYFAEEPLIDIDLVIGESAVEILGGRVTTLQSIW